MLEYIKYSGDKERLRDLVASDIRFQRVGVESARLMNMLTDSHLSIGPGEETVDMCKAIEDMRNEAWNEGLDEGMRKGKIEGKLQMLDELVREGVLTLADAAGRAGLSTEEFAARTVPV